MKTVKPEWYKIYERILIVDDSPGVWNYEESEKVSFLVPTEFTGDGKDNELQKITRELYDKYNF